MDKESIFAAMETIRQEHAEGKDVNRGIFRATTSDDGMMSFEINGKWRGVNFLMLVTEVVKRTYSILQGDVPDDELIGIISRSVELGFVRAKEAGGQ